MRRAKLLVLLSLIVSFQCFVSVPGQRPKHPDLKRRGRESAPTDKAGKWNRERKEDLKRGPEKENADKKSREERIGGRSTRDRADAWNRRQDRTGEKRKLENKTAGKRRVEKSERWDRRPRIESRESQQAKFRRHIFRGEINSIGRPVGFHHEGTGGRPAAGITVVKGSRSKPDANGVYKAVLEAGGLRKIYPHTFFPRNWSRAEVEKAINEAYVNKVKTGQAPNEFKGETSSGITVVMKINNGVLRTAYPVYQP